jgi:hypothetical protein
MVARNARENVLKQDNAQTLGQEPYARVKYSEDEK